MATWKIPEVQQEVRPTGPQVSSPVLLQEPDYSPGIRAVAQGTNAIAQAMKRAQDEADALRVNEELTAVEREMNDEALGKKLGPIDAAFEGTERSTGFLQVRGIEASKVAGDVTQRIDKSIQKRLEGLTANQRELFLQRARQLQTGFERRVTQHVVEEAEKAKLASVEAKKSEALRSIYADPLSIGWGATSAQVEEALSFSALNDEDKAAKLAAWRQQVAVTRISSLLAPGAEGEGTDAQRLEMAQRVFDESRDVLGAATDDVKKLLDKQRDAIDKVAEHDAAAEEVEGWVRKLRTPDSYVSPGQLDGLLQERLGTAKGERRKALVDEVRLQVRLEAERKAADQENHRNVVMRSMVKGGKGVARVDVEKSRAWLEQHDPDFLVGLQNKEEERYRRWLALRGESPTAVRAAAQKKQEDDDRTLRNRYAALSPEEQAKKSPEEFAVEWAATHPGFSPSEAAGFSEAAKHRAATIERMRTGDLKEELAFQKTAGKAIEAQTRTPAKTKGGRTVMVPNPEVSEDELKKAEGLAAQAYRSRRAQLGRDLTPVEQKQLLAELVVQKAWEEAGKKKKGPAVMEPGFMPGGYPAPFPKEQKTPPPPVKKPVPVRRLKKDGKWFTLFSDGSVAPEKTAKE